MKGRKLLGKEKMLVNREHFSFTKRFVKILSSNKEETFTTLNTMVIMTLQLKMVFNWSPQHEALQRLMVLFWKNLKAGYLVVIKWSKCIVNYLQMIKV